METDTAANPAGEGEVTLGDIVDLDNREAAEPEQQEATDPQADGDGSETLDDLVKEALGEETKASPELIDVEFDGETFQLPPKLRDALLRHQDYTRKTMDLGEERRAFDEERKTFQETANQIAQDYQDNVQLGSLKMQIQSLENLDVSGWPQEQVNAAVANLQTLRDAAGQLESAIDGRREQRTEAQQQARDRCMSEVAARVPNFTDERRQALESFAVEAGFNADEVANLTEPYAYEMLHYADIGKKFVESQRKAKSMTKAHAGTPATTLGGASAGGKSPEDMSYEEYAAWREAGNG